VNENCEVWKEYSVKRRKTLFGAQIWSPVNYRGSFNSAQKSAYRGFSDGAKISNQSTTKEVAQIS